MTAPAGKPKPAAKKANPKSSNGRVEVAQAKRAVAQKAKARAAST